MGQACRPEICDCVTCFTVCTVILEVLQVSDSSHVTVVNGWKIIARDQAMGVGFEGKGSTNKEYYVNKDFTERQQRGVPVHNWPVSSP